MNAKQIKTSFLSDLTEIQKMCLSEIGDFSKFPGTAEDYIFHGQSLLPEKWEINEMQFPSVFVPELLKRVKRHFPNGDEPKHKEKSKKELEKNGLSLQQKVELYRCAYKNGEARYKIYNYLREDWKILYKEQVIEKYERAKPNDLIRLCWKYITNPVDLEGVHVAWKTEPAVKFEPIGSFDVPNYMKQYEKAY